MRTDAAKWLRRRGTTGEDDSTNASEQGRHMNDDVVFTEPELSAATEARQSNCKNTEDTESKEFHRDSDHRRANPPAQPPAPLLTHSYTEMFRISPEH